MEPGFFSLKTPKDLFEKLKMEYLDLKKDPNNQRLAFNFFVTAEHLPEWANNKSIKRKHAILRICSQLANGGKHFKLNDSRHKSISSAKKDKYIEEGYVEDGYIEEPLIIELSESEVKDLGTKEITAIKLAEKILKFWAQQLNTKAPPLTEVPRPSLPIFSSSILELLHFVLKSALT